MPKEIILYNLAENVTEEDYQDYVTNKKGPLLESLSSVEKFELVKVLGSASGQIPYKYVGIVHLKSLVTSRRTMRPRRSSRIPAGMAYQSADFHILAGIEIY
jgi:hypothetical protein